MAQITTRQTAGTGATVAGVPLTNAQIDQNFINLNTDLSNAVYLSTAQTISGVKSFTDDLIHNSATNTKYVYFTRSGGISNEFTRVGRDDATTHFYTKNDETTSSVRFTFENTDTEAGGGVGANTTFIELTGSATPNISVNGQTVYHTGNIPTWNQSTTGNAASATILQTARTINGTSFNGSANITTASWGTSRTVTIGNTGKSVDGSSNVSWTLAEIGALGSSAKAADSELLDGQNSTDYLRTLTSGVQASLDTYIDNGIRNINYTGYSTHLLTWNIAGSPGTVQQEFDYNTAVRGWRIRNRTDNTTWTAWGYVALTTANQGHISGTLLHSANYNSYSPTLTGTGASGTWSISITGNAATVTNGVVTTGSYADPAWITSLAKSKVGLSNVENTALSTWAGSTNITTVGAITPTSVTSSGGITTSSATHRVQLGTDAGGSISIGRIDNVTSFPYIDFNSGATSTDFDVRLASTGGNGTAGNGLLTITGNLGLTGGLTLSSGTANGVLYLNGSKVATSGSALTFDGSGLSVLANSPTLTVYELASGNNNRLIISQPAAVTTYNSTFTTGSGAHAWQIGNSEQMRLTSTGLGIGTATINAKFVVNGGTVNTTTYTSSEARVSDGTIHLMKTVAGGVFEAVRAINNDVTVGTTVRVLAAATSDPFNNGNGGKVFIDAIRTATNMDLAFSLNDASGAAAVERVRIMGGGNVGIGTSSPTEKLDVAGNIKHTGLVMTAGTNVDQVYSVTDTLTLTTSWQDTTVNAAELASGTYVVQVRADDFAVGGGHYNTYYSGVMSWTALDTNETSSDEIVLHRAGHASNTGNLYLRVLRTATADVANLKLQIAGSTANTGTSNYEFKFRRLI